MALCIFQVSLIHHSFYQSGICPPFCAEPRIAANIFLRAAKQDSFATAQRMISPGSVAH
jgi:hypothetical protein